MVCQILTFAIFLYGIGLTAALCYYAVTQLMVNERRKALQFFLLSASSAVIFAVISEVLPNLFI